MQGGTRVIQNLLPVMRELGLVTIFWDGHFPSVQNVFDTNGALVDQAHLKRMDKFIKELVWMAQTDAMRCPQCGIAMNYHAEKIDNLAALTDAEAIDPDLGGVVGEVHACPGCGNMGTRRVSPEGE